MAIFAAVGKIRFPSLKYEDSHETLNGRLYLLLKRYKSRKSLIIRNDHRAPSAHDDRATSIEKT